MLEQLPYCGSPPHPGELLLRFNLDPRLIAALSVLALIQLAIAGNRRARTFALCGWLIAAAALISPLCALSVSLFSARVAQHMILLLIAAPLIAHALPRTSMHTARLLWLGGGVFFLALWFWHMPNPYDATFASTAAYWAMHVTLFGSGILLWRELLRHRAARAGDVLAVGVLSSMQMSLLGAVLTLATRPLFFRHFTTTTAWGLTPLQDQQLGGVLMWVPGMLLFLWVALRSLRRLWESLEGLRSA